MGHAELAQITRGDITESLHMGSIAIVDSAGNLAASVGDPDWVLFFRSAAKPFQAIPVIESGAADHFGFTPAEVALCCASHNGTEEHQAQVFAMLAKLGLTDSALKCGSPLPYDEVTRSEVVCGLRRSTPVQCNCSGKHVGMLATCLHLGYSIENYLCPSHPSQQQILAVIAEVCGLPPESIMLAGDGCSLPTFGLPLHRFARSYAVLARPTTHSDALTRIRSAMAAHPVNLEGEGEIATSLTSVGGGSIVAKSGAEGLLCLALTESGLGIAIGVADGSTRPHAVIAYECLAQLDVVPEAVLDALLAAHPPTIRDNNNEIVGEMRAGFELS